MKRLFILGFLISFLLQHSVLASCGKDTTITLTSSKSGNNIYLTLKVLNNTSNKIILRTLTYWPTPNKNQKGIKLNENLDPNGNFEKEYKIEYGKNIEKKNSKFGLTCNYGTYNKAEVRKKLKNRIIFWISIILLIGYWLYAKKRDQKKELSNYNKKNKTNFKTYDEYVDHLNELKWKAKVKQVRLNNQKKREKLETAEKLEKSSVILDENIDGIGLMNKIKRLKRLHKNGILTKDEFEKAKNKLLK
jgi:hypothetical protein